MEDNLTIGQHSCGQVKEVEAAAERAAAQSAAIIEDAMAQAEDLRRKAAQETHSQVPLPPFPLLNCSSQKLRWNYVETG